MVFTLYNSARPRFPRHQTEPHHTRSQFWTTATLNDGHATNYLFRKVKLNGCWYWTQAVSGQFLSTLFFSQGAAELDICTTFFCRGSGHTRHSLQPHDHHLLAFSPLAGALLLSAGQPRHSTKHPPPHLFSFVCLSTVQSLLIG